MQNNGHCDQCSTHTLRQASCFTSVPICARLQPSCTGSALHAHKGQFPPWCMFTYENPFTIGRTDTGGVDLSGNQKLHCICPGTSNYGLLYSWILIMIKVKRQKTPFFAVVHHVVLHMHNESCQSWDRWSDWLTAVLQSSWWVRSARRRQTSTAWGLCCGSCAPWTPPCCARLAKSCDAPLSVCTFAAHTLAEVPQTRDVMCCTLVNTFCTFLTLIVTAAQPPLLLESTFIAVKLHSLLYMLVK